ncbi:MAG: phytase [Rhodospirillaceae bacterium]
MQQKTLRLGGYVALIFLLSSCDVETMLRDVITAVFYDTEAKPQPEDTVSVMPLAETQPVLDGSDAADDPTIWINPDNPMQSWIVGTNKRRGVEVYNLDGQRVSQLDAGRINNVDLRAEVTISGEQKVVVAGTNRTSITIEVWALNPVTGQLSNLLDVPLPAEQEDPYGFCLYRSAIDGALYAIATAKEGGAKQWRLRDTGQGLLRGELVRTIPTASQPEGCVADDATGRLYIGEERVGIWSLGAEPTDPVEAMTLIAANRTEREAEAPVVPSERRLTSDVEGLAIYAPLGEDSEKGYLIASSQGNWTYVVFDRASPHAYRGTFAVVDNVSLNVDGTGETDGLDVVAVPVGPDYPQGMLVVQDGHNKDKTGADGADLNQNFKYISWADIAAALSLE